MKEEKEEEKKIEVSEDEALQRIKKGVKESEAFKMSAEKEKRQKESSLRRRNENALHEKSG